jgi:Flp pilus assembly protein TadD
MLNRGRYAEAVTHYWRAVNLAQNKSGPLGDVAAALFLSGEFADAVDVWLQTLELEPLPVTYSNLGSAYYFLRQYNEAAKMYEHAIELAPDDHLWWGHAGEAYLQLDTGTPQHYFERASELASAAREINPNDPLLASRLATYRAALGDMELARQLIGQARELGALDLDLLYDEAVVWSRLGETENARRTIAVLLDKGYSQELIDLDGNFSFSTHQGERQ